MADENKDKNIFQTVMDAGDGWVQSQVAKAKAKIEEDRSRSPESNELDEDHILYSKSVKHDRRTRIASRGYYEKGSLPPGTLKAMASRNHIIASVLQTRQNQAARFAEVAESDGDEGFKIVLKDRPLEIEKEELHILIEKGLASQEDINKFRDLGGEDSKIKREESENSLEGKSLDEVLDEEKEDVKEKLLEDKDKDKKEKMDPKKLRHMASDRVDSRFRKSKMSIERFILNCGEVEDRAF